MRRLSRPRTGFCLGLTDVPTSLVVPLWPRLHKQDSSAVLAEYEFVGMSGFDCLLGWDRIETARTTIRIQYLRHSQSVLVFLDPVVDRKDIVRQLSAQSFVLFAHLFDRGLQV